MEAIIIEELGQIFLLGDGRYNLLDLGNVYSFFINKALIMEKEEISLNNHRFRESDIQGPQKIQKAAALEILKDKGLIFVGFEKNIGWGRPDMLAKSKDGRLIAVECGPCRLSKTIDYFRNEDLIELWLVHVYSNENCLYVIRRGLNWKSFLREYDKKIMEQLKQIKSPMDTLKSFN